MAGPGSARSARTAARVRPFGGPFARLSLCEPLPLHVADRLLLRDPGAARDMTGAPAITGAIVLDVSPPGTPRRQPAAAARRELAGWPDPPTATDLLRRRGLARPAEVRAMGLDSQADGPAPVTAAGWLVDPEHWSGLRERLAGAVAEHAARDPLAPGMPLEAARAALGLPDRQLIEALAGPGPAASGYPLAIRDGCVRRAAAPEPHTPAAQQRPPAEPSPAVAEPGPDPERLPGPVADAVRSLRAELAASPFRAPEAGRLRELGLDRKAIAAAARAGLLLRIGPELVLAPGADDAAARVLARLPQPFTTAQARQALDTTRRVAIPLLEYLDRASVTRRLPDDRRTLRSG